jgi:hypothetical protein
MDLLEALCEKKTAEVHNFDVGQLRKFGVHLLAAFEPHATTWIVCGVMTALGLAWVLVHRIVKKDDAAVVVGNTIEGFLYGAIGSYSGAVAGIMIAAIVPPTVVGVALVVFAILSILFAIIASVRGTGDAGWKVLGFVEFVAIAAVLVVTAGFCFAIPGKGKAANEYATYLDAVSVTCAISGGLMAILAAIFRGAAVWIGWLLAHVNGGWGALGNLLGLMTHVACWNFYADHGKPHFDSRRRFYVRYAKAFSLKTNASGADFAFSEGAVISTEFDDLAKHESVHVLQHLIAGPFYPLTHFAWFILWIPIALIASRGKRIPDGSGGTKFVDPGDAITAMSYYSNPWEVIAYTTAGDRHAKDPLVFDDGPAWVACVLWILLGLAAFILLASWRFGLL